MIWPPEHNKIYCMDALAFMRLLPPKSVAMIMADLPYGTTACAWDTIIPFEPLWECFRHVIKPRGAIVLTASQPFTSKLVMSNLEWFHQELIWEKQHAKGFLDARRKHLNSHESILVFSESIPHYYPQGLRRTLVKSSRKNKAGNDVYNLVSSAPYWQTESNFPKSVLRFDAITFNNIHPTQKPVALFEYLIKTYTQPGDVVLDPVIGSGTTAVAARKLGRNFYGCDSSEEYVAIATKRLQDTDPYQPTIHENGLTQLSLLAMANGAAT